MRVLLFAGAGTSVELGVPAMTGMAEEFVAHAQQWDVEPAIVRKVLGTSMDVENLIEELDRICGARGSLGMLGQVSEAFPKFDKIRAEVEWFVQHVAERVVARDAQFMWGALLRATRSIDTTFVTTNYDRAIELAANAEGVRLDDGFAPFDEGESAPWMEFSRNRTNPLLVKLHGSTDWYAAATSGRPTKLRHPMPLFGRAALRLADGTELGSALVLPSREKLLTRDPYPRLSQAFLNASDSCDLAVFVGSSLRDSHVRGAAQSTARRVPVFLVNRAGKTHGIDGAISIATCASNFLISILPNALRTADPVAVLTDVAKRRVSDAPVLNTVRRAFDDDTGSDARCRAIEELDENGVCLDKPLLESLVGDRESTVARYALSLIPLSPACDHLLEYAAKCVHASERAFHEDLQLLKALLAPRNKENGAQLDDVPSG